ncbi:thiolase-like protein [Gigaspora rosea]|uniref:Thiolase-like protein n=1 Tax=Gigaspora rosea TaxID=44941 RepID=A0A397TY93_9GLOM|nr:thiolase-like protein [Gigaspora rosea]
MIPRFDFNLELEREFAKFVPINYKSLMAREAAVKALLAANITYISIQQVFAGYCFGENTSGQRAVYQLGMTQIPIINANNNCSTGYTALYLARQAVEFGTTECVLALGFEQMYLILLLIQCNAGLEYCEKCGATAEHMAKIGEKNHLHSTKNPYSQFRAVIMASENFTIENNLELQAIEIVALYTYDALGLCKMGEAHKLIDTGDVTGLIGGYVPSKYPDRMNDDLR